MLNSDTRKRLKLTRELLLLTRKCPVPDLATLWTRMLGTELVTMQISKSTDDVASCICERCCWRITRCRDCVST